MVKKQTPILSKPCKLCKSTFHTQTFCPDKPKKPLQRTAIKRVVKPMVVKKKAVVKPKTKHLSRKKVVKQLDAAYSQYIRLKDARMLNGKLKATCVTCLSTKYWREQQNGHFFTRGRYSTRWNDINCHVQCPACNIFLKGNYIPYTLYMIDRYGRETVDRLEKLSKTPTKIPTIELVELTKSYQQKVKAILG
jgi:hypothetical protein